MQEKKKKKPFLQNTTQNYNLQLTTSTPSPMSIPIAQAVLDPNYAKSQHQDPNAPNLPSAPQDTLHQHVVTPELTQWLSGQGFSDGLIKAAVCSANSFPRRIWIVDNSGSMNTDDGHRIVQNGNGTIILNSTRWAEIVDTVTYHAELASKLNASTEFRLLNHPNLPNVNQNVCVSGPDDLPEALRTMNSSRPGGCTPLTSHLQSIRAEFTPQYVNSLRSAGQRVVVVLATDGVPTDDSGYANTATEREFKTALQAFGGLPVWIVIRLCTDDDAICDYYNEIDNQLEIDLEVLDDFVGEAKEVCDLNPFLNYALPIHRLREFGFHDKVFDLLDEKQLSLSDLRHYVSILLGVEDEDVPDPQFSFKPFYDYVSAEQQKHGSAVYDPIKKKQVPLIDINKMWHTYQPGGCTLS